MPEVGWQIPDMRIAVAYARGMAKAHGIPFGVYYENWCAAPMEKDGKEVMSVIYSADSAENEWLEYDLRDAVWKNAPGEKLENGGSSLSLQSRIFHYAYISGAAMIGEEYGVCNTFYDYRDFEMSKYGKSKKAFLDFQSANPDIGKTFTPFAIVLPKDFPAIDIQSLCGSDKYLGFPLDESSDNPYGRKPIDLKLKNNVIKIREVLNRFFCAKEKMLGNEAHVLQNTEYPDVFDIIHEDETEALSCYDYLIDLTGNENFSAGRNNIVAPDEVPGILDKILPVGTDGKAHTVFNRISGGWLILMMNNNGVLRSEYKGDRFTGDADIVENIYFRDGRRDCRVIGGNGRIEDSGNGYAVNLKAGSWIAFTIGNRR